MQTRSPSHTSFAQYTYERELGEEYFWQWGGLMHPSKAKFIKNPLEELGLITELKLNLEIGI